MTEGETLFFNGREVDPDDDHYYDDKGQYQDVSAWGSIRNFVADRLGVWVCPVNRDSGGIPCRWRLHYECSECGRNWTSEWSCQCDDECPDCSTTIAPRDADDLLEIDDDDN